MKIASTALAMESAHYEMTRSERTERLEAWTRTPAPAPAPSAKEGNAPPAEQAFGTRTAHDWRLLLIKAFVEWLTGKPIKLIDEPAAPDAAAASTDPGAAPSTAPTAPRDAEFGVVYEFHASTVEVEQTDFSAQGTVTTADGRRIDLSLQLDMARSYVQQTDVTATAGSARHDPLVINLDAGPAQLSAQRMSFDLDADGREENVALLDSGSAYLALDANGNGRIDSGRELFGPATGSGFAELASYDADHNGWIDENDPIFEQLKVWRPSTNGEGQLASLKDANVGALFLGSQNTPFELRGTANEDLGAIRSTGLYLRESGEAGSLQEIDLTV
ncbi:MAG TPA: hypothetical protein VF816_08830 [Rhodocyclaceae bacterium]